MVTSFTPVPGTLKYQWLDVFKTGEYLVGSMYCGPEVNHIPHKITRVGIVEQEVESLNSVKYMEGWLFFELEGGTVVGLEDPVTRSPERREII